MGTHDPATLLRRALHELVNKGNTAIVDELFAPDFVEHARWPLVAQTGRDTVKHVFAMLHTAFPDLRAETHHVVAQGDMVVLYQTWRGTQTGLLFGVPPTGRSVSFDVFDMARVVNGKITEHWGLADQLFAFQQVEAIPALGEPRERYRDVLYPPRRGYSESALG